MSDYRARKERILSQVTLQDLFSHQGWSYDTDHRIICLNPEHNDVHPDMKIYDETNSVYCFACGFAGDVIRITSHCILGTKDFHSAIDWLEEHFSVTENKTVAKLRSIKKSKKAEINPKLHATYTVLDLFKEVEENAPSLSLGACIKDYILVDLHDEYGDDHIGWASASRSYIKGVYSKLINSKLEDLDLDIDSVVEPEYELLSREELMLCPI